MSRHAARPVRAVRDPQLPRSPGPSPRARGRRPLGERAVSAAELIARHRLLEAAATLPTAPLPALAVTEATPTVVAAAELIARHRGAPPTEAASRIDAVDAPVAARQDAASRPATVPFSAALDRARRGAASPARVRRPVPPSSGRRGAAHRPAPAPREVPLLAALRPARPLAVVVRPVLVAAAVVATVTAMDVPSVGHPSSVAADPPNAAGPDVVASAADTAVGGNDGATDAGSAVGGRVPVSGTPGPSAPTAGFSRPKSDTLTPGRTAPTPSATTTRISRDRRTSKPAHKPLMKAGQTVPGIWVKPNIGPETSCFCLRWGVMHEGIDLAGPLGSPILAVGDGVVINAGPADGFGNWVVIRHSNGDVSIYGHMQYYFVSVGEQVKAGQRIALVGNEGYSTGPHLHFEIRGGGFDGPAIDPQPWLKARGVSVGSYDQNG